MPKAAPRHRPMPRLAKVHAGPQVQENYGQGRGGRPWRRKRERVMKRDHFLCQPCLRQGKTTLGRQVDHVIPQAEGGSDDDDNLQTICDPCHDAKTKAEAARGVRRGRVGRKSGG